MRTKRVQTRAKQLQALELASSASPKSDKQNFGKKDQKSEEHEKWSAQRSQRDENVIQHRNQITGRMRFGLRFFAFKC